MLRSTTRGRILMSLDQPRAMKLKGNWVKLIRNTRRSSSVNWISLSFPLSCCCISSASLIGES